MRLARISGQRTPAAGMQIYLLAGGTSVLCAAVVVMALFVRPVEADTPLTRPVATLPPVPPAMLAPTIPARQSTRHDLLRGLATWYGEAFDGRLTASGNVFNMNELTACHPTLPFGTLVRVHNLRNHRSVVVRITDRGYLLKGRIIDVSLAAANELKMTNSGVAPVSLEVLALGPSRKH